MTAPNLKLRFFQFSLRRLLLWTAVWVAFLNVLLRLVTDTMPAPLPVAISLTLYLDMLLPIRIKWGYARGLRIALLGTVLVLIGIAETSIIVKRFAGECSSIVDKQWLLVPSFFLGSSLAMLGFVLVHIFVVAVDWLDRLMTDDRI